MSTERKTRGDVEIGFTLSSEERRPEELVRLARQAEEAGFPYALISDHFHPWTDAQGSSPFVWSVLGGIAATTTRLRVGTGVTCPIMRYHPAIVAHAAATVGCLMPGRFFLGVGSGESLNEHVTGLRWPPPDVRQEMLEEAVQVIRLLHQGGQQTHRGKYYEVPDARIYDLPEQPVPVYVAAAGKKAGRLAGKIGDGLICSAPSAEAVQAFESAGGAAKPRYGQLTVCWAESEQQALDTAMRFWPISGVSGQFKNELARVEYLEQAARLVTPDRLKQEIVCGPDPQRHLEGIAQFVKAGFDHVYVHQVGPDQEGFMRFYRREVLPNVGELAA